VQHHVRDVPLRPRRSWRASSKASKMSILRHPSFGLSAALSPSVMETLTLLASLPDNAALVLVGTALIVLASILKKRLISPHAEHGTTQGPTIEH
jgi:hypothetical protein